MFPQDAEVQAVKEAMFDPFEYFVLRARDGLLKKDFKAKLGKVSYHSPCHSRVQNVGQKTREMLQMIPDTTVTTVARCAGPDGTWGVKKEFFDNSMKIARPVVRALAAIKVQAALVNGADALSAARPGARRASRRSTNVSAGNCSAVRCRRRR